MDREEVLNYYKREKVLESLLKSAEEREVSTRLSTGNYTSRPNILQYSSDVIKFVKKGGVSFHGSVERWTNPMELGTKLREEDFNRLRKGWDLILDIDSELELEAGKFALKRVISFLEGYGIESYGIKFSGRRGFHVAVPWEAFPKKVDFEPAKEQFPKIPQAVANFLRNEIESDLLQDLIQMKGSFHELSKEVEGHLEKLSPFAFVEIEKDWGRRHLFRLPYSLHEKTGLVSYPLKRSEIDSFEKEEADPEEIEEGRKFLKDANRGEAKDLVVDALNWKSEQKEKKEEREEVEEIKPENPVQKGRFPPCIKLILEGIPDGRKRSVFILITFLRKMKWDWERIEEKLKEWNQKNDPPLPENYINTQLKWFKRQKRSLISPSCDNDLYYRSFGVCKPNEICKEGTDEIKIKNPVVYPFKKKGKKG